MSSYLIVEDILNILIYTLRNSAIILAFLPGALLAHIISEKLKLFLSRIDKIIVGISIWSFIFCASAVVIGLSTNYLVHFFILFKIISLIMLLLFSLTCLRKTILVKKNMVKSTFSSPTGLIIIIIISILSFYFTLSLYVPIFHQWDAITNYLVMAKSITLTGNLTYNIYYLSKESAFYPPIAPLLYAFLMSINGGYYFRFTGIYYLIILIIIIYAISLKISKNNTIVSIIASLTFTSFLAVQVLLTSESLYLDPLFLLYSSITIYALISSISSRNSSQEMFWLLVANIASSLSLLSNELGIICVFLVFSSIIKRATKKYLEEIILITPQITNYIWMLIRKYPIDLLISCGLLICFTFTILVFLSYRKQPHISNGANIKFNKKIILLFSPLFIPFIFYSSSLILTGNLSTRFMFQDYLIALSYGFIPSGGGPISPFNYWRWYGLFTSNWIGAYYIPFSMLGMRTLFLFSKRDEKAELILKYLLVLLLSWSVFYFCNFQGTDYRRLTYLAPIFSIMVAEGIYGLFRDRKLQYLISAYYVLYTAIVMCYNWFFRWSFPSYYEKIINLVDYPGNVISDPLGVAIFNTVSVLMLLLIYYSQKTKAKIKQPLRIMLTCSLLAMFFITYLNIGYFNFIKVKKHSLDPTFYDSYHIIWFCNDVIEYYNNAVNDSYVTLVLDSHALPISFFANRTVVGPVTLQAFIPLISVLNYNSITDLLHKLHGKGIKYILVAKDNLPGSRIRQISFLERYPEFKDIIANKSYRVADFKHFILYKIKNES